MPSQMRGLWSCIYCNTSFGNFHDAQDHEQVCQHRQAFQRSIHANLAFPPMMDGYNPFPGQFQPAFFPPRLEREVGANARTIVRGGKTSFPLMGLDDDKSFLEDADAAACQSLELFTLPRFDSQSVRQLALRCSFCARGGIQPGAVTIPEKIEEVGKSVRQLAQDHLPSCELAPLEVRSLIDQTKRKRQRIRDESSPSWHQDQLYQQSLQDYCMARCQMLGIVTSADGNGILLNPAKSSLVENPQERKRHGLIDIRNEQGAYRFQGVGFQRRPSLYSDFHEDDQSSHPSMGMTDSPLDQIEPMPLHEPTNTSITERQEKQQLQHVLRHDNMPFFQERNGDWVCRYCSHLPPALRDDQYVWSTPSKVPPIKPFVDYHLSLCRGYNQLHGTPFHNYSDYPNHHTNAFSGFQTLQSGLEDAPSNRFGPQRAQLMAESRVVRKEPQIMSRIAAGRNSESSGDINEHAIELLSQIDRSVLDVHGNELPESSRLVVDEDRLLLTDYFFFLMKQLRLVRFTESDRRTRGGKRENIKVGYGGLECVHCAIDAKNARKFFWSDVDRLANSFAEIPAHVIKCRRCPENIKDALLELKKSHKEQMSRLPRGSQKVFFRRMWRRLHDDDPKAPTESNENHSPGSARNFSERGNKANLTVSVSLKEESPDRTASSSDESTLPLVRPGPEAATALRQASIQDGPPSPSSRVLLAMPEDKEWLSDTDCFVRRQIEVFSASKDDVEVATKERKYINLGQVGIRCVHCAIAGTACMSAVAYPSSMNGIYEAVREFQRLHLANCQHLPIAVKTELCKMQGAASLSSVLRTYYVLSAHAIGLRDTPEGIRTGGKVTPIGSFSAVAFSEKNLPTDKLVAMDETKKRKAEYEPHQLLKKPPRDEV